MEQKEERCSNCVFNRFDLELHRYYCSNDFSDCYESTTEYNDSCEYWEGK
jgi:hypothetical protein